MLMDIISKNVSMYASTFSAPAHMTLIDDVCRTWSFSFIRGLTLEDLHCTVRHGEHMLLDSL